MTDNKPRVFSGIQPTGRKTLGNYSGGFRQYAQTQETHDAFFCIVDLHSITVASRPGVTSAEQPASSRRATTSSTWSWVALAPMTISNSGAPTTAIGASKGTRVSSTSMQQITGSWWWQSER